MTEAPPSKYGDASASYWKLYEHEAHINDKDFVESLKGSTESMVFLVRSDAIRRFRIYGAVSYN